MKKENKIIIWLKKNGKDLWTLIVQIVIFVVASPVFIIAGIIGLIYSLIKHLIKKDFSLKKYLSPIVRVGTLLTDCFANAGAGELMNDIIKPKYKFGKWYQTISAITGINYLKAKEYGSVEKFRNILNKMLGKNHCELSITESDKKAYSIKEDYKLSK